MSHPLKKYLLKYELTAEQFADRVREHGADTTAGYISQIMIDHRYPGRAIAVAISHATGGEVSIAGLLEFKTGEAA